MAQHRIRLWPFLGATLGVLILATLGTWQYGRAQHKADAEHARKARIALPPLQLTSSRDIASKHAFRAVDLKGHIDYTRSVLFKHRAYEHRPGFWLAAPLIFTDGSAAWANLGWVPTKLGPKKALELATQKTDTTPVPWRAMVHILDRNIADTRSRQALKHNGLGHEASSSIAQWRSYDIEALQGALKEEHPTPISILVLDQQHSQNPFPIASTAYVTKPYMTSERHMSYAAFWYTTACALFLLYLGYSLGYIGSFGTHRQTSSNEQKHDGDTLRHGENNKNKTKQNKTSMTIK